MRVPPILPNTYLCKGNAIADSIHPSVCGYIYITFIQILKIGCNFTSYLHGKDFNWFHHSTRLKVGTSKKW